MMESRKKLVSTVFRYSYKGFAAFCVAFFVVYLIGWCFRSGPHGTRLFATGTGLVDTAGGVKAGVWSLYTDGTVIVTAEIPESWVEIKGAAPPDAPAKPQGEAILWKSNRGHYRYEIIVPPRKAAK